MNNDFTTTYSDENGSRIVSVSPEDSRLALKNDFDEILRNYDPNVVTIERCPTGPGEALHLKVTVHAPSHYLVSATDTDPKPCDYMTAHVICYPGYPLKSIRAYYMSNYRLASPNVFSSGVACIDTWVPFTSSLVTVVEKLVHDMIHDPQVTRYDSVACHSMVIWHRSHAQAGEFPTIPPKSLYAIQTTPLPPRRNRAQSNMLPPRRNRAQSDTLPSLPRRTH